MRTFHVAAALGIGSATLFLVLCGIAYIRWKANEGVLRREPLFPAVAIVLALAAAILSVVVAMLEWMK